MSKLIPVTPGVARVAADTFGSVEAARSSMDRGRHRSGMDGLEHRVISISDLHVGVGTDPLTGHADVTDDWRPLQQIQLFRLLGRQWARAAGDDPSLAKLSDLQSPSNVDRDTVRRAPQPDYQLTLNLNGDVFELMQATQPRAGHPFPDGFDGGGPRTTPANTLVKLNQIWQGQPEFFQTLALHLALGHHVDFLPGNHDRDLWNDLVWSGQLEVDGKELLGMESILRSEMKGFGLTDREADSALERVRRLPFAVYGDSWFDHGHHEDPFNRTRRPYREVLGDTKPHDEMPQAFGDYGVRDGYDALERKVPSLTERYHDPRAFLDAAWQAPQSLVGAVRGFLKATQKQYHDSSAEADAATRLEDASSLVDAMPEIVDMLNQHRPPEERLTPDQVKTGLQNIEKATATPLYSMLGSGANLFRRIGALLKAQKQTHESHRERKLDALFEQFGISNLVQGHTHEAADQSFVNADGHRLRYVNTHTWMDQSGRLGPVSATWGENGRGVKVLDIGKDSDGRVWSRGRLGVVRDATGEVTPGTLIESIPEVSDKELERARVIFEKSKRGRNRDGPVWKQAPLGEGRRRKV
ncbi:MAG TPA: hypothetical protein RMG48_13805 [Myxococcales bacterium LLY-WYZ-16_1]|nr:hypothetical protein [Myxococcales bacterium LLY-WYZ-16_1]